MASNKSSQCNLMLLSHQIVTKSVMCQTIFKKSSYNKTTQTLKLKELTKPKAKDFSSQATTKDSTTQTSYWFVNKFSPTDSDSVDKFSQTDNVNKFSQAERSVEIFIHNIQELQNQQVSIFMQAVISNCQLFYLNIRYSHNSRGLKTITITNPKLAGLLGEDIDLIQVVVSENGKCSIIIPFCPIKVINISKSTDTENSELMKNILELLRGEDFAICPGIKENVGLQANVNTLVFTAPFSRMHAKDCPVYYKSNGTKKMRCEHCKKHTRCLYNKRKRSSNVTLNTKLKRTKCESNYPITQLFAMSKKIRLSNIKKNRRSLRDRIAILEKQIEQKDMLLNDDQSEEIL